MKIFKYQPINSYSLAGLAEKELFYSHIGRFNDPFEFRTGIDVCSDEYIEKIRRDNASLKNELDDLSNERIREMLRKTFSEELAEYGVVSMSKRSDSALMWGHYAANHRGICLSFEVHDPALLHEVSYSNELPILSEPDTTFWHKDAVGKILTTKQLDWQYEQEVRLLGEGADRTRPYPAGMQLVSVIFGLRTPERDKKLIKKLFAGRRVCFGNAVLDEVAYGLRIESE